MSEQFESQKEIELDKKQFILSKIPYEWTSLSKLIFVINTANKTLKEMAENDIATYYKYFVTLNDEGMIEDRTYDEEVQIRRKSDFGDRGIYNPNLPGLGLRNIKIHKILQFSRQNILVK